MEIFLIFLKIATSFIIVSAIYYGFMIKDTSAFKRINVKSGKIMSKIITYKQIKNLEICFKKISLPFNLMSISAFLCIGVVFFSLAFTICNVIFPLKSLVVIVSLPFLLTPFFIIKKLVEREQVRLESGLNDFFIQLKAALSVNPDIIESLRRIQNMVLEPFRGYTKQMLSEVNAGRLPEKALEDFANKINIKKFSLYINNVRYCHSYGGDIGVLTEKTQVVISEAIKQKKKRNKETRSARNTLYVLIVIDLYMYFSFIGDNSFYLKLMIDTFIGNLILNVNFISIWGLLWLSESIKKFDY